MPKINWTVSKRIAAIAAIGLLTTFLVAFVSFHQLGKVDVESKKLAEIRKALVTLRALDTRASELKVDGFKAVTFDDPTTAQADVADDTAQVQELLTELKSYDLDAANTAQVDQIATKFGDYTAAIKTFVDAAVADQAGMHGKVDQIQAANDITDETVGGAIDDFAKDAASANKLRDDATSEMKNLILIVGLVGMALLVGLSTLIARSLVVPLRAAIALVQGLAKGDLTHRSPAKSTGCVGLLEVAINETMESVSSIVTSVVASADAVAAASEELSASSQQIAAGAEESALQAGVVSEAAEEVSRNVETVAAGAEEMGASIREIAHSANEAARVAAQAVTMVETTNATVGKLGDSSQEIGNVVKVITSIAEQTNLLALNATIEAARAGEAGKGFAVVANEVKELAQETAQATEDIARRVQAIQGDTEGAVAAIGEISTIIASINDYQLTIASAVEEQTATTNEMSRNIGEAAGGVEQIAGNMSSVVDSAGTATEAAGESQHAARALAEVSSDLRTLVGAFRF